ncbi:adenosylmethionine--8-amino-7-oxononanoate transaminase [Permianibacter aggregans]|uniref:Adenosylmethionine-8-amino-7-oxononanoate aminotransferase n=1 Tax=Permianibacter aggregans TaxID=1510150 RepID=A0A4R6UR09_9GAMM|nr:adenosylmethionine--8-amino-7-oxononanoate transaminase [Permianibacter aggregans]QGX40389.1 adenosylmethionine--8-amino-7-oxononanoate transaminase [Permianibacter aggregans]TDQ49481.1 adenosylmethionine-8-amino-7-oxononanoate aminotransferase [Permianibacter aggregans]
MNNQQMMQRDLAHLWHPCTQMSDHERYPLIPIKRGDGVYLEDFDGKRYIDAISSWWTNILGHGNPEIRDAIKDQLDQIEHVIFAGFSHQPAVELGEKLAALTPGNLNKCFFGENGSSAIEIALKMSFHYWRNAGKTDKTKFVALKNGYHGETLGALAVGDVALFKETYAPLLMEAMLVDSPDCYFREAGESWQQYTERQFVAMEKMLAERHGEIAAVILEPLVQCATGMRMYHPVYLKLLREACDRYGVHLIADEIAVGFGRTGTMFACNQADITPDFLCLSKALTSGFLPLSAVMTSDAVFNAFYDSYESMRGFLHSHSYTGNPLACRSACATIDLLLRDNWLEKNQRTQQLLRHALEDLQDHPNVAELRQTGMIIALEVVKDKASKTPFDWRERRGLRMYQHAQQHGALIRPIGSVVYLMPPYVVSDEQIATLTEIIRTGLPLMVQ